MTVNRYILNENVEVEDTSTCMTFDSFTEIITVLNGQDARIKYLERKLERERCYTKKQHLKWSEQAEERIRELENSKKQLKRVYNYFMDYLEDEMSRNSFSEMWDFVITDEKWD